MAIIETRLTHDMHRSATTLLAEASLRDSVPVETLSALREFLVRNLHHHHQTEDDQLWPMITAAAPRTADGLAGLSTEHDKLDAALDALESVAVKNDNDRPALHAAAVVVRDLVHSHLEHEEPILFPALREHVSAEAWAAFSQQVIATSPTESAFLVVGFFDEVGSKEEVAAVLAGLPEPVQPLIPAMREQARIVLATLSGKN